MLIGVALIGSAIYSWIKPNVNQGAKDILRDAGAILMFLVGLLSELKGVKDLFRKDTEKISINKIESGAQVSFGSSSKNIQANQYVENLIQIEQSDTISALSELPLVVRAGLDITPIGRDKELSYLKSTDNDTLVVGQPGSGKTFLFYQLARDGLGLFINSTDSNKIIRAYKDKKPNLLFVDDAQLYERVINDLIRFRTETDSKFIIIASCWPSSKDKIMRVLNISESRTVTLNLLTRDEIVQVINSVGLTYPDFLVQEIVEQAVGRPGLAVTLADMCLKGDARDVYFGEILTRSLSKFLLKSQCAFSCFCCGRTSGNVY